MARSTAGRASRRRRNWRRALLLGLVFAAAIVVASLDALHAPVLRLIAVTEEAIDLYPIAGRILFVVSAAISGMLAFVSSAVLVPVAVYAWGPVQCALLLWLGWIVGGCLAYGVGRVLGRPVVERLVEPAVVARYEGRFRERASFGLVLLFQMALPSELPGYVLGIVRYGLARYLAILAIAELPFAIGTVTLGESFVSQRVWLLVGVGAAAVLFSGIAFGWLHRLLGRDPDDAA